MSLFVDRGKMLRIEKTVDYIKDLFGETAILPASSFLNAGQAMKRSARIGGHYSKTLNKNCYKQAMSSGCGLLPN